MQGKGVNFIIRKTAYSALLHVIENVGYTIVYVLVRLGIDRGKQFIGLRSLFQITLYRYFEVIGCFIFCFHRSWDLWGELLRPL